MLIKNLNLHIRRFEFKYVVPNTELDKIRRSIGNFTILDPYAKKDRDDTYQVTSLYFDDTNLSSYYEKLAGIKLRKKFRIRTYETRPAAKSPIFLEIKRRDEIIIFKDRFPLDFSSLKYLEGGSWDKLLSGGNDEVLRKFIGHYLARGLKPTVMTSYRREAYLDRKNFSFRLTLDQQLAAKRAYGIDLRSHDTREVFRGYTILEAKFNRIMPSWFGMIVKKHNLERVSFSKYCFGLEACGIVPKTDLSKFEPAWIY